jgi:hypothetical protein
VIGRGRSLVRDDLEDVPAWVVETHRVGVVRGLGGAAGSSTLVAVVRPVAERDPGRLDALEDGVEPVGIHHEREVT